MTEVSDIVLAEASDIVPAEASDSISAETSGKISDNTPYNALPEASDGITALMKICRSGYLRINVADERTSWKRW